MTEELKLETIAKGNYSGLEGPRNSWVIDTQQAWSAFYNKLESKNILRPTAPSVDFSHYTILAVYMGQKSSGGYSTEISKVLQNGKDLEVQVQEFSHSNSMSMALTQPYHIVKVPKAEGKVEFKYLG